MKNKLLALLFVLAVLVGVMALSANAATTTQTVSCPHCGSTDAVWYSLNEAGIDAGYDHYYLSDHLSLTAQIILTDKSICLDLNGYTLTGYPRAFLLRGTTTLSIIDSSENKSGQMIGTYVAASQSGGTISVASGCELNIYGGTFSYDSTNGKAQYGGVLYTEGGTINIYDGKIIGGACKSNGGAIALRYATSELNIYGGEVISGNADGNGDCISAFRDADGTVRVGADAVVDEIWYGQAPTADTFQIIETDNTPAFAGNVVVNGNKVTMYDTLATAMENVGTGYVILSADVKTLDVSKDITIDLNGKDITTLNVATGATVKLRDRKTEDYSITDGDYGIVKNISGNVVADDSHVVVTATEGTSCHYYSMALTSVTLRPGSNGIYYKSEFLGDSMVAQQISTFGVALNLSEEPNATNMKPGAYSIFTAEDFGGENNSTVLINIMKPANSAATNAANAQKKVYGRAYMKLTDGSCLFSDTAYYSLQELTEVISQDYWTELTDTQKSDLLQMYGRFGDAMADWDIENIVNGYNELMKDETETLKVLMVGNSHSLDTFHLLYDVIEAEGIPADSAYKNVELGVLYYGGCRMSKHAEHAKGDVAAYDYYRVGPSTNGEWVKTPSTTMKTGLQAEQWDIVVLQEMSMEQGIFESDYTSNATTSTQYVCNYIKRTLGYAPEFRWNLVWSNPTIPDCCDEENYTTDAQYKTKWIYKLQSPAYGGYLDGYYSWEDRAMSFYGNNPQQQHNLMTKYVQEHIIGKYGITTADKVVNPGTTMMYALNNLTLSGSTYNLLANEQFAYRDYTHLSDVSRVMVSYLWYAELFGLDQIDSLAYTTVPAAMRAKDKTADVVMTQTMQDNIIEAVNYTLANPFGQYQYDGATNILLIGNSSCYYWTDELWGMLDAAGYENVNVYNLYYSGASLKQHYNWWKNDETPCQLICHNAQGRTVTQNMNLKYALTEQQWDYVSILPAASNYRNYTTADQVMATITPYLGEILELVKENAPNARLFWQESWGSQLNNPDYDRTNMVKRIQEVSPIIADTYDLEVVPLSGMWEEVRDLPVFAEPGQDSGWEKFTLFTRISNGSLVDDSGHDGDVGGGQYLNACAFYEAFTGLDCRKNTFRPKYTYNSMDYSLTEEEIGLLQNAAHNAVHPEDEAFNVLLIGNSSCYYWTDELWGMLDAAGYENVNVYNLYYSAATLQQHHDWMNNGESVCDLICVNANGRKTTKNMNIKDALSAQTWDYVSVMQTTKYYLETLDIAKDSITPYLGNILKYIKQEAPEAKLLWQEVWAYELGHTRNYNVGQGTKSFVMDTVTKRTAMASMATQVSQWIAEEYGLTVVPVSDAWEAVRDQFIVDVDTAVEQSDGSTKNLYTLCTRFTGGRVYDDLSHDGDIGGGQYLNACIFYEMLTGKDCRENTYRPKYIYNSVDYSLTAQEISLLQNAAHNSVQNS